MVCEGERPFSPASQRPGLLLTVSPTGPVDGHEDVRYPRETASHVRAKLTGGSVASLRLRDISPSLPCYPVAVHRGVAQRHQDGVTPYLKPWGDEGPGSPSNGSIQAADLLHTSRDETTSPTTSIHVFLTRKQPSQPFPKRSPCAAIRPSVRTCQCTRTVCR